MRFRALTAARTAPGRTETLNRKIESHTPLRCGSACAVGCVRIGIIPGGDCASSKKRSTSHDVRSKQIEAHQGMLSLQQIDRDSAESLIGPRHSALGTRELNALIDCLIGR
jgi:hypothetical protein